MTTGNPYVRPHARTKWSEAALVAEYGELGSYGVSGSNRSVPDDRLPNTSSVDTCRKRNGRSAARCCSQ